MRQEGPWGAAVFCFKEFGGFGVLVPRSPQLLYKRCQDAVIHCQSPSVSHLLSPAQWTHHGCHLPAAGAASGR